MHNPFKWQNAAPLLKRYSGLISAFAYSGANFFLAFVLQKSIAPADFGFFALVQVFVQFGLSLSNGLFCSPIILAISSKEANKFEVVASFTRACAIFCVLMGVCLLFYALLAGGGIWLAAYASLYGVLSWSRWFFRSVELADGHVVRPALADAFYSFVVCVSVAGGLTFYKVDLQAAFLIQAIGCGSAFIAMGPIVRSVVRLMFVADFTSFRRSFRAHGQWASVGVITTEVMANAHPYLIGSFLGTVAFAPIAAVALFYRPITIIAQALTQYERPRMARAIDVNDRQSVDRDVRAFSLVSLAGWVANSVIVMCLVFVFRGAIGTSEYDHREVSISAGLLMLIYLVRSLRGGQSAALQAAGQFKKLAWVTVFAAPATLIPAAVLVWLVPQHASYSLTGVLFGEVLTCLMIRSLYVNVLAKNILAKEGLAQ